MADPTDDLDDLDPEVAGQARCEVLAALSLAAAAALVLYGISQAIAVAMASDGPQGGPDTWDLVSVAAGTSALVPSFPSGVSGHALLLLAYLLVIHIGPGSRIGRLGDRVLQGVLAVGALMAIGGLILTVRLLIEKSAVEESYTVPSAFGGDGGYEPDVAVSVVARGGSALPMAFGAVLAGYLAWIAARSFLDTAEPPALDDATDDGDRPRDR